MITHGFVLNKGTFEQVDHPDADVFTSVNGVNAKGERAGIYRVAGRNYAYFWRKGKFTKLDLPGWTFSQAYFLNDKGQVVGYSKDADGKRHGFVWHKGHFTTPLDADGADSTGTRLIGINDRGQIVGFYQDSAPAPADRRSHGLLLSDDKYTTLDVPGAEDGKTIAQGINNRGQIVGLYATTVNGPNHGFVLNDGVYTKVDVPGSSWTAITSINAKGEIVGACGDADGVHVHGFKGTPNGKDEIVGECKGTPEHY